MRTGSGCRDSTRGLVALVACTLVQLRPCEGLVANVVCAVVQTTLAPASYRFPMERRDADYLVYCAEGFVKALEEARVLAFEGEVGGQLIDAMQRARGHLDNIGDSPERPAKVSAARPTTSC